MDNVMRPNAFQNDEAERNVLAFIVTHKAQTNVIEQLRAADFNSAENRKIFEAIALLNAAKKPTDMVAVNNELMKTDDGLDVVLAAYAREKTCNTEWQANYCVEIIKKAAERRRVFDIVNGAKDRLLDESTETADVIEKTRQELRDLVTTGQKYESMMDVLIEGHTAIERRSRGLEKGMTTGLSSLDKITTGLYRGELTILGARPAVGKSALGMHMAIAAARAGYKVAICSREMTDVQYGMRIISRAVDFPSSKLRTGDIDKDENGDYLDKGEWKQIQESMDLNASLPMTFMFSTRNVEDLRQNVQRLVDTEGLDLLMVDYLQLMQTHRKFEQDYQRIGYVSKMLKDMTIDFNIAVLALAQVGRSSENSMPTMAELRGSGDMEQDADNIIFMHRAKDKTDKNIRDEDRARFDDLAPKGLQYIVIDTVKQRQGKIGRTAVHFNPDHMTYTAIATGADA